MPKADLLNKQYYWVKIVEGFDWEPGYYNDSRWFVINSDGQGMPIVFKIGEHIPKPSKKRK